MTDYERDCIRTISKWLNEGAGPVPLQEIATMVPAFVVLDACAQKCFETQEMAAAPDLLKALEEALENWEDDHFDEDYPYRIEWADKARAAIKKARGESGGIK